MGRLRDSSIPRGTAEFRRNLIDTAGFAQFGVLQRWLQAFSDVAITISNIQGMDASGNPHRVRTDAAGFVATNPAVGTTLNVNQISVGTAATAIVQANTNRTQLVVTNIGAATVFLGGSGVTTATGQALLANATITLPTSAAVYGIVAAGTVAVTYAETAA